MELYPYQKEAVAAYWDWLGNRPGNPLIVLPTGSGKSFVAASLCYRAATEFGVRTLVLAHVKELLAQNEAELLPLVEEAGVSVGVYSAGLRRREYNRQVVFAGIQSVAEKADLFQEFKHVLIDEAHLVPPDGEGRYRTFLNELREYVPNVRIGGLTATPYRTGTGKLWGPDQIFQGVCYTAQLPRLISEGYLSPVVNCEADSSLDTSALHISRGEFIQTDQEWLFSPDEVVSRQCSEIRQRCQDRKAVMVFCTCVAHAEKVASCIESLRAGDRVVMVHGGSTPIERHAAVEGIKSGAFKFLVNVNLFTTGFNARNVDAIAVMRATASPGLFAQIVGRGLRLYPGKQDCLLLDFGENLKRHGPLDSPSYGERSSSKRSGESEESVGGSGAKQCPACGLEVPRGTKVCDCGFLFPTLEQAPDTSSSVLAKPMTFAVGSVEYSLHRKKKEPNAIPTVRVTYWCHDPERETAGNLAGSGEKVEEWICLEHDGFAGIKARKWWRQRSLEPVPQSCEEAVEWLQAGCARTPSQIVARQDGRWWRIDKAMFGVDDEYPAPRYGQPCEDANEEDSIGSEVNHLFSGVDNEIPF